MVWYWHKIDVWTYGIEFKSPETDPYFSGQFNVDKDVIYLMRKEQSSQQMMLGNCMKKKKKREKESNLILIPHHTQNINSGQIKDLNVNAQTIRPHRGKSS